MEEALDDAIVSVWSAPTAGHSRFELWIAAGSLDGSAPLVAAVMAEIWAARSGAEPWVTPSLTVLSLEGTKKELDAAVGKLLRAVTEPPREEELLAALEAVSDARARQQRAPEREAIAAAFAAMGIDEALPLGDDEDPAPSLDALAAYANDAISLGRVRGLFIGEVDGATVRSVERKLGALDERPAARDRRQGRGATDRRLGFREGAPAWTLVAVVDSATKAEGLRDLLEVGPFSLREAHVEIAPSHLGSFVVVSGRGTPTPEQARAWAREIARLARWVGAFSPPRTLDLRERARRVALRFGAARGETRLTAPRFALGLVGRGEAEFDREAFLEAIDVRLEPVAIPHDASGAHEHVVVARFPALFSGEPASEAGRGALLLRALVGSCEKHGHTVEATSMNGDGWMSFTLPDRPHLGQVQSIARCLLGAPPDAITWEGVRARMLDELARDPLHPAFEALASALYPSAPASALPAQTRALRHRSGDGRMAQALADRRGRGAISFAVTGPMHEAIATQFGLVLAALPEASPPPRPLEEGVPDLGPRVVDVDAPSLFLAGVRLDSRSTTAALAFVSAWVKRARDKGLPALRALAGGHPIEGYAMIAVPLGGSDPETLRGLLEAALPDEGAYRAALDAIARERAYLPPPVDPALAEDPRPPLPAVRGRAYVLGRGL